MYKAEEAVVTVAIFNVSLERTLFSVLFFFFNFVILSSFS